MRPKLITFLFLSTLAAGCKTTSPPAGNSQPGPQETTASSSSPVVQSSPGVPGEATLVKPKLDACALLTVTEIESVQGEKVKETKLSGHSSGGLSISQCFFTLPTFNNSISLIVAHPGEGVGAREPKEFWRTTFHEHQAKKGEAKSSDKREEESEPPKRIAGIGDEAFWMGNRIAGAVYVLKGNAYVRVSVGGPSDKASQTRARMLAQKAIARL